VKSALMDVHLQLWCAKRTNFGRCLHFVRAHSDLCAENVGILRADDPLNSKFEVVINKVNTLIAKVWRKKRAERIQELFDLSNSLVVLKITVNGLNNKFTNRAILTSLGADRFHQAMRTEAELRAHNIRREFLNQ